MSREGGGVLISVVVPHSAVDGCGRAEREIDLDLDLVPQRKRRELAMEYAARFETGESVYALIPDAQITPPKPPMHVSKVRPRWACCFRGAAALESREARHCNRAWVRTCMGGGTGARGAVSVEDDYLRPPPRTRCVWVAAAGRRESEAAYGDGARCQWESSFNPWRRVYM